MANEISVSATLAVANGNASYSKTFSKSFTQAAVGGPTPGFVTIGTSEESQAFSELTTEGWIRMENLDTTNYVEWGFATAVYGGRLEAGEIALFRVNPAATIYLKANTAACKMLIDCFED